MSPSSGLQITRDPAEYTSHGHGPVAKNFNRDALCACMYHTRQHSATQTMYSSDDIQLPWHTTHLTAFTARDQWYIN